jgi:hypothetical protein
LFLGYVNMGIWPSRLGILTSEMVKYVVSPTGLAPKNDCADEGQQQL